MEGWIKLHRKIIDWQWFTSAPHYKLWSILMIRANHKESIHRDEVIKPGQLLTGRKQLSLWSGFSEQQVRTMLNDFKASREITIKSNNKYSLITILNWHEYNLTNQEINQLSTKHQPATNQQPTTSKNDNNANNDKNIIIKASPLSFLFDSKPLIQEWLNAGNHDTHLVLVKEHSHHELAELIEKAYDWAQAKNQRAETWLITFMNNKNTKAYGANQAQKSFSRKSNGLTPTPENPTGSPYLQEAIDKGLTA